MKSKKQKGFTALELLITLFTILVVIGIVGSIWVLAHFIIKVW